MSEPASPPPATTDRATHEHQSALFTNLVVQQTNLALLFLGKTPQPDGGQSEVNLDMASLCIDTLDMLAVKTAGNLEKQEHDLLQQSLTALRMAFVEAAEHAETAPPPRSSAPVAADAATPSASSAPDTPADTKPDAESTRRKFVKRY